MRDFFERQESARKRTTLLVALFFTAVVLIVISVYVALNLMYYALVVYEARKIVPFDFWNYGRFVIICLITVAWIIGGTLYKINKLKGGGYKVAEMLGGHLIQRNTADLNEKKLLNVVEEMAIASGMPVPGAYVMNLETGINAFAAGYGIDDAVVCVTRGSLDYLNREELQAVVAHEFSHISNGDTGMNIRLMGWLHGILVISLTGRLLLRDFKYARVRSAAAAAVLGAALYMLGSIGLFFGKIIKSAVSRQREYLADASAVQFTRNPHALASALKKIGGMMFGPVLLNPMAGEASHMFICDGVGGNLLSIMATHPPLVERIRRLDPHFDGVFSKVKAVPIEVKRPGPPVKRIPRVAMPGIVSGAMAVSILETIGAPMEEHAHAARALIDEVPGPVRLATREPAGAIALIYALLLDADEQVRGRQIDILRKFTASDAFAESDTIAAYLPSVSSRLRLPLVDLCMPVLKTLSKEQYDRFKDVVKRLTEADEKISSFEFVLSRVLIRRLDAHFSGPVSRASQIYNVKGVALECSVALSLLAHAGQEDAEQARKAFEHGRKVLSEPGTGVRFLSTEECTIERMDRALEKLALTSPLIKKKLMAACLECLIFDKTIRVEEAELFRAVGESLGIPVPPWLMFRGEETKPV